MPKRIDKPINPLTEKTNKKNINKIVRQSSKKLKKNLNKIASQSKAKQHNGVGKIVKESKPKNISTLPTATELVLNNIMDIAKKFPAYSSIQDKIENWSPLSSWTEGLTKAKENDRNVMINALNGAIKSQGEEAVARRIEENAVEIESLVMEILYASGSKEGNFKDGRTQVNFDLVRFSTIIMGRSLTPEESIDFTNTVESMEVNN